MSELAAVPATRRIDCSIYEGDLDALVGHLAERTSDVDVFVIVESTHTPEGRAKPLHLRSNWAAVRAHAHKIRYVVTDEVGGLTERSADDRAAEVFARALTDVQPGDDVTISRLSPDSDRGLIRFRPPWRRPSRDQQPDRVDETRHRRGASSTAPVIVCPYVHDEDVARVTKAFGLDDERGAKLEVHFWKDVDLIGPERSFEACWNRFPDRDVILLHTDMEPMPADRTNEWYDELLDWSHRLPDAGAIVCNLLFPPEGARPPAVQCAGGYIAAGRIGHIGGRDQPYDASLQKVRRVDWVTFGGVLLRREVLDMCGSFDPRYEWAYVMDVDYCLEMTIRGGHLYQVPVELLHHENTTTRPFLEQAGYKRIVERNAERFYEKWAARVAPDAETSVEPSEGLAGSAS